MRIELLNVECEFQVPVVFGRRNVYVTTVDTAASTSDMNNIAFRLCAMGYQSIHVTSQRTGNNETKAYPTIRICLLITLTGDCLSRNAQTSYAKCPLWVINPKPSKGKGDDAEYPIRQRSSHSNLPNDLLQKLCKKDVLDGQIGILADTGLRINEYGGLLFCSIGYTDGSQGRMYFIRVSGQLSRQNTRTEYPKTDPSYRLIPISQELGERLIAERENLELRYGDMSLLLRIGQPEESEYYTDAVTISSHMRQLKEQIPQLLRQPEFLEEMRKNRPYTFDKASQDEYLNNMLTSHALRRYFCTWLYTVSGVETNEIYSLMGHLNKNIRQRSGPCGPTPAEIYRLCLLKHVSRTLFHAAHPLQYNLGEKCRETEVPACSVEFTIPPETSWEIVVEDSEPFNHVALRGNGITWDVRYQDEFRPNPNRYALLATEEMYTIQSKGKFLDALKKATKGEKLNK